MPMKLYAHPDNYKTKKILIAASYAQLDIEAPGKGGDAAATGKIPVLETDQGCIFASNAIARYISRIRRDVGLYGQNLIENGMVDSWIEFCTHELEVPMCTWVYPLMGIFEEVPEATKQAKEDVKKALNVLNNHLLHNTYMVGHQMTLADVCVACSLVDGLRLVLDTEFRKPFGNLMRWFNLCMAQPEFSSVLGKVELCGGAPAKGGAKPAAKEQPKKEEKPKQEKKAEKPASSPKASAKKEPKAEAKKEGKKGKKEEKPADEAPKEKTPEELAAEKKAKLKKVVKEGGKRGVEIEGAADMGGLGYFCTSVEEPGGDMELIEESMKAMNAESDPTEEERKGGSGRIGKMLFSAGDERLALCAYVPKEKESELDATVWLEHVCKEFGGEIVKKGKGLATGCVKTDSNKGVFPLKVKEPGIMCAITYLKGKGLFPDQDDSDDDYVFGDDDFPS